METTQGCFVLFWTNPESNTPQNSGFTTTYHPSHKPMKKYEQDMLWISANIRTNLKAKFNYERSSMNTPTLAN